MTKREILATAIGGSLGAVMVLNGQSAHPDGSLPVPLFIITVLAMLFILHKDWQ